MTRTYRYSELQNTHGTRFFIEEYAGKFSAKMWRYGHFRNDLAVVDADQLQTRPNIRRLKYFELT